MTARAPLTPSFLVLLLLTACSPSPAPPAETEALRPGDSLLDRPEQLEIVTLAVSSLPVEVPQNIRGVLATRTFVLPPDRWAPSDAPVTADELPRQAVGEPADYRRWIARPALRLDLELGDQWLRHADQAASPHVPPRRRGTDMTRVGNWTGAQNAVHFRWHPDTGELHCLALEAPGSVEFGYRASADSLMAHVETGRPAPATAKDLVRRVTLAEVDRPALLTPAPSELRTRLRSRGDALRVAVGALPLGFTSMHEQLRRDDDRSDGSTFSVEVVGPNGSERVWSRHVTPAEGWIEDEIDLSAYTGQEIELHLITGPGPAGDATADYAVWSDLRIQGEPPETPPRPHVLLIDADTLRADRLGMYGAERPTSPRLDAWAEEHAVIYEQGHTAANWTLPSTVSILTGLSVTQHGVREFPRALTEDTEPLALRLKRAGYETYARTDGGFVNAAFGFHLGFDVFDFNAYPHAEHAARGWKAELRRLRERRSDRPVFYFLQTYMVHAPYMQDRRFVEDDPGYQGPFTTERITQQYHKQVLQGTADPMTEADWEYLRALYDAGVRRMDDVVMDFVDGAREVFGDEPFVVVFTSDHGEELHDHGLFGHGHTLFREQLFVPFVIEFPDGRTGRERSPVSSLDLVPTLLDVAGLEIPAHLPGRSLLVPPPARRLIVAEDEALSAAFLDGWKLLSGSAHSYGWSHRGNSLFHSETDPLDTHDVLAEQEQLAGKLEAQLRQFHERHPPRYDADAAAQDVDPAVIARLEALGYLGDDG